MKFVGCQEKNNITNACILLEAFILVMELEEIGPWTVQIDANANFGLCN